MWFARKRGREFVYSTATEPKEVGIGALGRVLKVFYNDSLADAFAPRLDGGGSPPNDEEIEKLERLNRQALQQSAKGEIS